MLPRSAYAHTHTSILYVTPCVCPGVCPLGSKVSLIDLSSQKQLLDQFLSAEARQQGAEYPPADSFWSPDICGWKLRLCTRAEFVLNSVDPEDQRPEELQTFSLVRKEKPPKLRH